MKLGQAHDGYQSVLAHLAKDQVAYENNPSELTATRFLTSMYASAAWVGPGGKIKNKEATQIYEDIRSYAMILTQSGAFTPQVRDKALQDYAQSAQIVDPFRLPGFKAFYGEISPAINRKTAEVIRRNEGAKNAALESLFWAADVLTSVTRSGHLSTGRLPTGNLSFHQQPMLSDRIKTLCNSPILALGDNQWAQKDANLIYAHLKNNNPAHAIVVADRMYKAIRAKALNTPLVHGLEVGEVDKKLNRMVSPIDLNGQPQTPFAILAKDPSWRPPLYNLSPNCPIYDASTKAALAAPLQQTPSRPVPTTPQIPPRQPPGPPHSVPPMSAQTRAAGDALLSAAYLVVTLARLEYLAENNFSPPRALMGRLNETLNQLGPTFPAGVREVHALYGTPGKGVSSALDESRRLLSHVELHAKRSGVPQADIANVDLKVKRLTDRTMTGPQMKAPIVYSPNFAPDWVPSYVSANPILNNPQWQQLEKLAGVARSSTPGSLGGP